jgi:hypothetical protein
VKLLPEELHMATEPTSLSKSPSYTRCEELSLFLCSLENYIVMWHL